MSVSSALMTRHDACPGSAQTEQRLPFADRLALRAQKLGHRSRHLCLDGHLHLHRLENDDGVPLVDRVTHGDLDLPHGARDMRLDLGHLQHPVPLTRSREPQANSMPSAITLRVSVGWITSSRMMLCAASH